MNAYPNPFTEEMMISYTILGEAQVSLTIYDIMGREVANLVDGQIQEAAHWLKHNLAYCLITNHAKALRAIDIPTTLIEQAAEKMIFALQEKQHQHQYQRQAGP